MPGDEQEREDEKEGKTGHRNGVGGGERTQDRPLGSSVTHADAPSVPGDLARRPAVRERPGFPKPVRSTFGAI